MSNISLFSKKRFTGLFFYCSDKNNLYKIIKALSFENAFIILR
jgi:hypothetical protein